MTERDYATACPDLPRSGFNVRKKLYRFVAHIEQQNRHQAVSIFIRFFAVWPQQDIGDGLSEFAIAQLLIVIIVAIIPKNDAFLKKKRRSVLSQAVQDFQEFCNVLLFFFRRSDIDLKIRIHSQRRVVREYATTIGKCRFNGDIKQIVSQNGVRLSAESALVWLSADLSLIFCGISGFSPHFSPRGEGSSFW